LIFSRFDEAIIRGGQGPMTEETGNLRGEWGGGAPQFDD